jgi:hypothetical protein
VRYVPRSIVRFLTDYDNLKRFPSIGMPPLRFLSEKWSEAARLFDHYYAEGLQEVKRRG